MVLIDATTGTELSFSVFYLVPVLFAGATISRGAGRTMAIVSAAAWGYAEVVAGVSYSAGWVPIWNSAVRLAFFLIVTELVQAVRQAHADERERSREDPLTGIANRRAFSAHLEQSLSRSRRDGRPFTVAFVDLDHFKEVNDTLGHAEGDRVLQAVAATITQHLRATDVVARLGGDEFGILMADCGPAQARASLDRIAMSLAHTLDERRSVRATFGAVTFDAPPDDVDATLRLADDLMYRGKAEGRGRILQASWPSASSLQD
ncbi:MAG: GGDEF domain-containing protein [Trueperaceae bacterium]